MPPVAVDRCGFADVEDAELDRRVGVVEGERDEFAVVVEDHREVAGRRLVTDRCHRFFEHPWVAGTDVPERVWRDAHGEALLAGSRNAEQALVEGVTGHGWNDATTPTSGATSPA